MASVKRHTASAGLDRLKPDERQVITMAYLEGMSNPQIASELGVSVSTVRRRLSLALGRLDEFVRRGEAWVSAAALLGLAWLSRYAHRAGTADWSHRLAAATTAAAVATVVLVVSDSPAPASASPVHPSIVAMAPPVRDVGPAPIASIQTSSHLSPTQPAAPGVDSAPHLAAVTAPTITSGGASHPGCGGNPTSAAPPVPVGPRTGQPRGAPVTHPSKGGCRG